MSCKLNQFKVNEILKRYGSPLYIFHANEFRENYQNLLDTMRETYPKYNIAYSYKTNYTPAVIEAVKDMGGLAEVVSDMEYQLAKKIGYANKDIVYNGPVKGDGLYEHLLAGGTGNIDSLDELKSVVCFAEKHPEISFKIAFRVNIDINQGFISRFGLDAYEDDESDKASELTQGFQTVSKVKNISVSGLHCHVGKSRGLDAWENRVRIMFRLVDRYFEKTPEFIDFGSGMNSVMEPELASQFGGYIPSFSEYAAIVGGRMKEKYGKLPYDEQPLLLTEPGTTLISGCMSFLSTVQSIKTVKGKTYVTFDSSGGNMGDICHLKNLPITVYRCGGETKKVENATFVGYTCLEHDHIYEDFSGDISVGDVAQFRNIGSYSNVFKPPFILPNCAMVKLEENEEKTDSIQSVYINDISVIKEKESFEDIFHTYTFRVKKV